MNMLKHQLARLATLVVMAMLAAGTSYAGNTNTLRVTASITGTCNFNTANNLAGNATLDFGALDQTLATDAIATPTSLQYWCTNGTAVVGFTADLGANSASCPGGGRCLTNGTDLIPYTLTFVDPTGTSGSGKTSPITINFGASILNADYVDAGSGSYDDTVTLTISP